jgi:hypothetical protein
MSRFSGGSLFTQYHFFLMIFVSNSIDFQFTWKLSAPNEYLFVYQSICLFRRFPQLGMRKRQTGKKKSSNDGQPMWRPSNQLCSFIYQLPDVLLKRKRTEKMPYAETYHGIALFADVSGFTEMCEKYSSDVQRGVNQLANALNDYMAPIVEAVLRANGDVYKFAGDAVLGKQAHRMFALE